jgi:catechol 2,3-dioxygenase-like lactoylglutathione lyase family enzyme
MRLHFIELQVSDWVASVAWYRDTLGLEVVLLDAAAQFALLQTGPGRIALKAGTPTPGGILLAWEVDDLAAWQSRLALEDVKSSREGYRRARFTDPDGYTLTLFEWTRPVTPPVSAE